MAIAKKDPDKAVFLTGSTMRHVVVMTATSSVGLVSVFFVDAINLFYIALLGQQELAAAIGYAATIMFFSISINIGLSIATSAMVGRALGAGDPEGARRLATSSVIILVSTAVALAVFLYFTVGFFLHLLGARGETLRLAVDFMHIVVPSIPLLGFVMCAGALLRAKGDPKRAMYVTLTGGAAALVLDPILIFGLDMGLTGAAVSTFVVRAIMALVGYWAVVRVHDMLGPFEGQKSLEAARPFMVIAIPAVATQLATPVGNAYVTEAVAGFGDDAVAGWAIVGRLMPVAFGTIFALSGAVGPILSQNYGARQFDRVNSAMRDALIFTTIYCLSAWAVLALLSGEIVALFGATGDAALVIRTFCLFVAASFLFNGALFVANAAFNNLGFPVYATVFNWGRATLGIIPFVWLGQRLGGAEGVLIGWGLGAVVFGIGAVIVAFRVINSLPARAAKEDAQEAERKPVYPASQSAFTSGKGASVGLD